MLEQRRDGGRVIADGSADGISDAQDFTPVSHSSGEWYLGHPCELRIARCWVLVEIQPVCAGGRTGDVTSDHGGGDLITGVHTIIFTADAEADRAFFRDVLGLPSFDAGEGWLIFALPPAELAAHPADGDGHHELYLMCDDVHATVEELKAKGVEFSRSVSDEGFGLVTGIRLPGGGELGLYEPRHPTPLSPSP